MSKVEDTSTSKYRQLSAFIIMIFADSTRHNPKFEVSGYDIAQIAIELRYPFSHQQIYREIRKIDVLSKRSVYQEEKPDKALYCLNSPDDEFITNLADRIDYNPKKTNLKMFLAFEHVEAVTKAYLSMIEFINEFIKQESSLTEKLMNKPGRSLFTNAIYKHDLSEHEMLLSSLREHLINIVNDQMDYDGATAYLTKIDKQTSVDAKWKLAA